MCLIFFLLVFEAEKKKFYYVGLPGLGLAGSRDLGFSFREILSLNKSPRRLYH